MTFAVIETGGKQYHITQGVKITVEKLDGEVGKSISFDKVLIKSTGENLEIGTPYVKGSVEAKIVGHVRDDKKIVFRYHPKTRYRKLKGHRQPMTEVQIEKI